MQELPPPGLGEVARLQLVADIELYAGRPERRSREQTAAQWQPEATRGKCDPQWRHGIGKCKTTRTSRAIVTTVESIGPPGRSCTRGNGQAHPQSTCAPSTACSSASLPPVCSAGGAARRSMTPL